MPNSLFLFYLLQFLLKSSSIHFSRYGQTEREGDPDAQNAQAAREPQGVAQRQGDDEIGDEGIEHHRLHTGDATQRIGKGILQSVAKLIYHHQDNQRSHIRLHLHIIIKPATYLMAKQEYRQTHTQREQQVQPEPVAKL